MSLRSGRPLKAAFVALLLASAGARAEAPNPDLAPGSPEVTAAATASGVAVPHEEKTAEADHAGNKGDAAAPDDPESQAEVDKGAAELEEVRRAE